MRAAIIYLSLLLLTAALSVDFAYARGPCFKIPKDDVIYLPTLKQCNSKAAIVLSGEFLNAFSVVTRDCNNNDRDPCYRHLGARSCASNSSSPFKAIKRLQGTALVNSISKRVAVYCFRESGLGSVYQSIVRRITIKRQNPVKRPTDIVRLCLTDRSQPTGEFSNLRVSSTKNIGKTGYSALCNNQEYLNCLISYCDTCDAARDNPVCG